MRSRSLPVWVALLLAVVGLGRYCMQRQRNPVTGELQHVAMSTQQEVALGLRSAPMMAEQYGGDLHDRTVAPYVQGVGQRLVLRSLAKDSPYRFQFHVLRDLRTLNAFALPGGQIFITLALLAKMQTEAQLAGVLGHEIGHVIARHGAQHLAKQQLGQSLVQAVGIGASGDGNDRTAMRLAQAGNQLINMKFGRQDELESDRYGYQIMIAAGYNPSGIVELMRILAASGDGGRKPAFMSTHPDPGNREALLEQLLQKQPSAQRQALEVGQEAYGQHVLLPLSEAQSRRPRPLPPNPT